MFSKLSTRRPAVAAAAIAFAVVTIGCETVPGNRTTQGAVLGSLAGAGAGVLAAGEGDNLAGGLIGAAVGGVAGGLIGRYLDNQAREIDAIPDANVERQADRLLVTFPGDTFFDSGSSRIAPGAGQRLNSLSQTLRSYPESNVVIRGHTDSTGSEAANLRLSEDRANNVRNYLVNGGVSPSRITAMGFGEQFPIATNATEAGRQQNRRVEIEIVPRRDELQESPRY
ncbi:OmpA family protein [Myxococcota bacterium]|nr:OmpA family protein [Myxococcota bacterium]